MTPNSPDITYNVVPIFVPAADNHVWKYKELRLTSLKLDPAAFSSSHEREAQFTDETWRERVNGTQKVTVVAEITMTGPSHFSECPNAYEKPWVGMATTISHQMLLDFKFPFPKSLDGLLVYALNGLWVHPDHRDKGLAKRIHQCTIDWVKAHHDVEGNQKKVLLVLVKPDNVAAISLYRTLGYKIIEEEIHPGCLSLTLPVIE